MKSCLIKLSIIISIIVVILLIAYFIFGYFQNKKLAEINKQLELREQQIKELEKKKKASDEANKLKDIEIEKLKKQKVVTKTEYVYLTDPEKEKAYNDLYDNYQIALKIIDDSTKIIETKDNIIEEQSQVIQADEKIINDLKAMAKVKKFGVGIYGLAGLNENIKLDAIIGIDVNFYFLNNRITLSTGAWVKPVETIAGGLKLGIGINF